MENIDKEKKKKEVPMPTGGSIVLKDLVGHIWAKCFIEVISYNYSKETGKKVNNKSKMEYYGLVENIKPDLPALEYEVNWINNSAHTDQKDTKQIITITVKKWCEIDGSV